MIVTCKWRSHFAINFHYYVVDTDNPKNLAFIQRDYSAECRK